MLKIFRYGRNLGFIMYNLNFVIVLTTLKIGFLCIELLSAVFIFNRHYPFLFKGATECQHPRLDLCLIGLFSLNLTRPLSICPKESVALFIFINPGVKPGFVPHYAGSKILRYFNFKNLNIMAVL